MFRALKKEGEPAHACAASEQNCEGWWSTGFYRMGLQSGQSEAAFGPAQLLHSTQLDKFIFPTQSDVVPLVSRFLRVCHRGHL